MTPTMTRIAATLLAVAGAMTGAVGVSTAGPPAHGAKAARGQDAGQLATARRHPERPRIVVSRRPYPPEEPGAIYGYAPGNYLVGWNGVLYGPYPLNPNAPIAQLRY